MASSMVPSTITPSTIPRHNQVVTHIKVSNFVASNNNNNNQGFNVSSMGVRVSARFGFNRGGGGAVLERPTFDQSQFDPSTQLEEGGDMGRLKDKRGTGSGDSYRVLLLDDERHTEKLVAKVLPQAVPSVTPDDARKLFSVSRQDGVAVVIVTVKEHAEFYSQMMIRWGLRSSIEPDSNTV